MSDIHDVLAAEAADAQSRRDEPPGRMTRSRTHGAVTNHVYTVRMPADRLAELRAVAESSGLPPSTLMRQWVLERLDDETSAQGTLGDVRRKLADAMHTIDRLGQRPA